jgi:hypothetical protein
MRDACYMHVPATLVTTHYEIMCGVARSLPLLPSGTDAAVRNIRTKQLEALNDIAENPLHIDGREIGSQQLSLWSLYHLQL